MALHPGEHWREIMAMRGVTQKHVADELGISPKHLNQIVRGNVLPSVKHVVAFARLMEVSPYLLWHWQADYELEQALVQG